MLRKLTSCAAIAVGLVVNPVSANLLDIDVLVTNTFQGVSTGGVEVEFSKSTANVSSATTEFPSFIDLYDVDIAANSITFNWVQTDFSQSVSGPIPAGNFDRNYFVFDLPANLSITGISFDALASNLLSGSVEPSAELIAPNQVLTVFGEGIISDLGFNPVFSVTTTNVPEPMSLALVCLGLAGLNRMRRS